MRSRRIIIVLLAVCSNVAVGGVLRPPRGPGAAQRHNVARFLNNTEISSSPSDVETSTTVPISSSSIITPLIAASPETSSFGPAPSTAPTATSLTFNVVSISSPATDLPTTSALGQGSLTSATLPTTLSTAAGSGAESEVTPSSAESAVVQPTDTASRLFNLVENPSSDLQPSTNAPSSSSTSFPEFSASLLATSGISSATNNPNAAATTSSSPAVFTLFEESLNASATVGTSQVTPYSTTSVATIPSDSASQSPSAVVIPVPISSGPVQVSAANGGAAEEFAPVTLDSSSPAPTGTAKYPTAENGNAAMAAGYNSVYKTLNTDSPCNPGDPSQAYACVEGEIAECQSDGTYVLKSCPSLQSCYALPKASGSTGIVVQCAVPSDAYSILAGLSSSTAGPSAVTSQPAQTLQVGGSLSQATPSASVQSLVQPVTSSSAAQTIIQSQTSASTATVLAVTATLSQNQGSEGGDEATASSTTSPTSVQSASQSQSQTIDSPVPAVTATTQQFHVSESLSGSTTSSSTSPSSTPPSSSPPSNTPPSSTSPSVPVTTAPVQSIPNALFAVVTAPENDQTSSSENAKQSSLPTPSAQADDTDDSAQPTTEANVTTSTSSPSSDGAASSITFTPTTGVPVNEKLAPAAGGNGQATVTVTVTVTTTERPAPVTISAS